MRWTASLKEQQQTTRAVQRSVRFLSLGVSGRIMTTITPHHFVCKKPGTMWQNYEHHHRMEAIPPAVLLRKLLQKETFYDWGVHAGGATMIQLDY